MWQKNFTDSTRYPPVSETWDSDGYSNYTPSSLESMDGKKRHDRNPLHCCSRKDMKHIPNSRYYHEQEYPKSVSQMKSCLDDDNSCQKALRDELRTKKEHRGEEKKKHSKTINPIYIVNAPNCYGYFNYDEVVQQLQGSKKIYKHSTEKKLY